MLRNDDINRVRFDSLTEMVRWIRANSAESHNMTQTKLKFYGRTTGEQALHFAQFGNDKNVAEAQRLMDQFSAELALTAYADEPTVAGCYPVVAEFLAGEPECMRLPQEVNADSAPLSVFVELTCSATIEPAAMRTRGVAILAAIMALSAVRPITLEVGCVMGASRRASGLNGERVSLVSVMLDTAPLDLATAAWMLSDVAAARRLIYGAAHVLHDFNGQWPEFFGAEYGAVESEAHCARVRELLDLPGDTLYIPAVCNYGNGNATSVFANPLKWCEGIVQQFGGALAPAF